MASCTRTVLIIEHFSVDRELYRRSLLADSDCAYRLLEVDTATAGLALCQTQTIDAILLDYLLPDGDGLRFLELLNVQSHGETPPVVMVAGEGDETIAVRAIKLGAEDYLVKRCLTPEVLRFTVRSAIENARLRLQLRQSEAQLRESQARLELALEGTHQGMWDYDPLTGKALCSKQCKRLFGLEPDEAAVTDAQLFLCVHPDDRDRVAAEVRSVLQTGSQFDIEYRVVWADGSVHWLLAKARVRRDAQRQPIQLIGTVMDVSDRRRDAGELKRVEEALHQSEERYRYLAELIPQLVWIAEPSGKMLNVNERWSVFTGLTLEQVQREGWQSIVYPEDAPILGEAWRAAQQEGTYYQAEGRMRRSDGVYRWHLHQAMPLKNEQGEVIKWFGTATDIDELKQIEGERARLLVETQTAREAAEAANRSKDDFVTLVAHELRSPLNAILGWAKLLQTRKLDAATTARALETITRNTYAQVRLVEDLLDVSRIMHGALQLTMTPVNLMEVMSAALETVRPLAEAKQMQLETYLHEVAPVLGDANRLQQIVLNLLTNAIKFTPEGGRIQVLLDRPHSQVRIQIKDTGKGISADFLPHIFERFSQDQQNTTAKQGLGLGLAIVKHLVELHHGKIAVESQGEGQGATFTVLLPLLQECESVSDELPAPLQVTPPISLPLAQVRVLLVDDEPDILSLTALVLEEYGAVVQTATSAAAALEQLAQFQPHILVSDVAMPEQDGYELLRQMRTTYPAGQIPAGASLLPKAIALSAYTNHTWQAQSLQAGFQQHLTKPVEPEQLVNAILRAIHQGES